MPSSEATWSPPPLLKRSRSYSDEEEFEDELYGDEDESRQRHRFLPPTSPSFAHSENCHALFAPYWSLEEGGWCGSKAEDDVALLMEIEERAETYSPSAPGPTTSTIFSSILLSDAGLQFRLNSPPNDPDQPALNVTHEAIQTPPTLPLPSTEKPFKCQICPKSFTRNYDLTRHKSSHQDERAHVCEYCGRSFNRRDALSRHNVVRGCGQNGQIGTRYKPGT